MKEIVHLNFFPLCKKMKLKHLEYDEGPRPSLWTKTKQNPPKHLSAVQLLNSIIFSKRETVTLSLETPEPPSYTSPLGLPSSWRDNRGIDSGLMEVNHLKRVQTIRFSVMFGTGGTIPSGLDNLRSNKSIYPAWSVFVFPVCSSRFKRWLWFNVSSSVIWNAISAKCIYTVTGNHSRL